MLRIVRSSVLPFVSVIFALLVFATSARSQDIGAGGNNFGYDMAPETTQPVVEAAVAQIPVKMPDGKVKPRWDSLEENYRVPAWYTGAKLGIFIHWGIFSVPAHGNEWYEKYMYAGGHDSTLETMHDKTTYSPWHVAHFGPQERFGYKDFIPMFRAEHFDARSWAELFRQAGARFVIPGAQHHENFAMWNSKVTPFNSVQMGPHRDVIGELASAVRHEGMRFGVANHGIENFEFVHPPTELAEKMRAGKTDLFDPKWADFYNVADRSDAALKRFLVNWYERNVELIDNYKPDLIYFDNGIDQRYLDPLKLEVAAYYYNRAASWGEEVSLITKKAAYAPGGTNLHTIGSITDFEGHSPRNIRGGVWEEDNTIGAGSWGYTHELRIKSLDEILAMLVDCVSKNGTLLLNVSPMADGTIPDDQRHALLALGQWLKTNGEAIYDSHAWVRDTDEHAKNVHFTVANNALYAIVMNSGKETDLALTSLALDSKSPQHIIGVTLLGDSASVRFHQDDQGLRIQIPRDAPRAPYVFKILGSKLNPSPSTLSGNPAL